MNAIVPQNKYIKRFIIALILIILIFFTFEIFTPQANAATPKKQVQTSHVLKGNPQHDQILKINKLYATSTTTTTTVPKKETAVVKAVTPSSPNTTSVAQPQGDWVSQCHTWATMAGIELPPAAIKLIERESKCNPNAQNPTSSACGIAQNIRGCNSPGYGYDPVQQLKWFHSYCFGRYGSFEAALQHSYSHGWY